MQLGRIWAIINQAMENYSSSLKNQHSRLPVSKRLTLTESTGRLARIKLFNFGEDT